MKQFKPADDIQAHLAYYDEDLIIIDKIQDMPESNAFYSEYMVIMLCTSGKIQVVYDGGTYTVHENELFLCAPNSVLSDCMISPNFDCKFIAIKPNELVASQTLHKQILNSLLYIKTHPVTALSEDERDTFFAYYHLICRIIQQTNRYHRGEVRSLLSAFLLGVIDTLSHDMDTPMAQTSLHGDKIVQQYMKLVNEDCGKNRQVRYYADLLSITPKYLSHLVHTNLSRKPSDIITAVTMKEIERQLRYTGKSAKEISNDLNFPNTSFFSRYFKQHSGMSPLTYRNKYR